MATPLAHESRELLRLLGDGEWHPVSDIRQKLAGRVPPGRALRVYEVKSASRERRHGPRATRDPDMEEKIGYGRNTLVNQAMNSMRYRYVEFDEPANGESRQVRIRPAMLDTVRRRYIRQLDTARSPSPAEHDDESKDEADEYDTPAPSTFDEGRFRRLVAEEVNAALADALDAFQHGMERYLEERFAEIARPRPPRYRKQDRRVPKDLRY